ncbi:hypothetical protein D187_007916 [Cystobacter fuscus DSM 2262]|uniref:Uncharacterized protein n=1 Tax=Cystobacter fuscus (strain ATCC 25194 / DSM 2262 / NBRC 100088 / M29) TaxID=1242864 RepID=S9Q5H9_CYSF2|nr:hypothetical protein D187_007916 [Cystobacter fuscus DSM 2262]
MGPVGAFAWKEGAEQLVANLHGFDVLRLSHILRQTMAGRRTHSCLLGYRSSRGMKGSMSNEFVGPRTETP